MVNLALIGCGYWGKNYVSTIRNIPNMRLKYIHDLKPRKIPVPDNTIFTKNLERVLEDHEVKGVMIVTPTITHFDLAKKSIKRGKHVLVEKPMTTDSNKALTLCKLAKLHEVNLMVGHIFKYNIAVKTIQQKIRNGELGELRYIEARRVGLGPIRQDVDVLWDFAAHDIYISNMLVGKFPLSVSCIGISHNGKLDDIASLNLKYKNPDVMATVYVNWEHPVKERRIIAGGSEKAIFFDDIEPADKIKIFNRGVDYLHSKIGFGTFQAITKQGDTLIPKLDLNPPLEEEIKHFVECMNGATCLSDGYDGADVIRILEASEDSKQRGGAEVIL